MSREKENLLKRLRVVVNSIRQSLDELTQLLKAEQFSMPELERLEKEQLRMSTEKHRLIAELRIISLVSPDLHRLSEKVPRQRPVREQVLEVLNEIKVPATPRTISEYARARYSLELSPARFASLRRDEQNSYKKNSASRSAWVVPAIRTDDFSAMPRIVANSAWEPERRLIGTRTLRVNHLYALLSLLESVPEVRENGFNFEKLTALIRDFASSVPGALERSSKCDFDRIEEAVKKELAWLEPLDLAERNEAAERLAGIPVVSQLWGRTELVLLKKAAGGGRNDIE